MAQAQLDKAKANVTQLLENDTRNGVEITRKRHKNFTILKYNKERCLPSEYFKVGYLRTMVIDRDLNQVVCVGPNKSIPLEEIQSYANGPLDYEEFVDGVMINVFWDTTNQKWQYATRSNIGADIRFYLQNDEGKTFRAMFDEALAEDNIVLDVLPKSWCYSFVLQHPSNRIVAPVEKPHAVLVEAHEISESIVTLYPHGSTESDKELRALVDEHSIPIPAHYSYTNPQEAREKHATRNTYFGEVGVIVKNYETGWRSKIRNPLYEEVKQLRGNYPKLQYLYLVLRGSGNVKRYLGYYKEHANEFEKYRKQLHNYTHNLYVNYVDCFINKKAHINTYPHQYKVSMTSLHTIYLEELMPKRKHIHKGVVVNYVNALPPQRLMYLLNYHYRK
jgi:hypothetical protein